MKAVFLKEKFLFFIAAAILTFFPQAPSGAGVFNDGASFSVAKTVKLGRGTASSFGDMSDLGSGSTVEIIKDCDPNCISCNKSTGICSKCNSSYYLYDNTCSTCPQYATCNGTPDMTCPAPGYFQMDKKCYTCSSAIQYCTACEGANKCTACESPYVVSEETGQCEQPPTCGAAVMQANSDVAAPTDAATFYEALSSGKNIILVETDMTVSASTSLGSKKLVGPKYFSDVAICASMATPTLTYGSTATLTMSGGEINQLNLSFQTSDTSVDAVSGSGTIRDASITSKMMRNTVKATGKITLAGSVTATSQQRNSTGYAIQSVLQSDTTSGSFDITGTTTVKGAADYGLKINTGSKTTIASTGSLIWAITDGFVGIDLENNSTFTANGPVKFEQPVSSAIGYITTGKAVINLNASGNYIKTTYSGLMQTHGDININGSTTIECFRAQGSSSCTAIDSHETYSSSVNSVTISAPLTLVNFNKIHDSQYPTIYGDTILSIVGGTLKINSTIESKANIGKLMLNGESMSIGSSGAVLGATYMYGYKRGVTVSAGAKMKLGGVCRKAASGGTMTVPDSGNAVTSPISPFTSGC